MNAARQTHLPTLAHALLLPLSALSLGAGYLVPDRGVDFQSIYVATASWANTAFQRPSLDVVTNLNHPLMMLVVWPFAWMSFDVALRAWTTCSILATCAAGVLIARQARMPVLDVTLIILSATGTLIAFSLGQVTAVLTIVFTIAWLADRNERHGLAGCCLGLLCLLKPFYGLFVPYLAWRREWRALATCVLTYVAGTVIAVGMVGVAGLRVWLANLGTVNWQSHLYNGSVWGVGNRLLTESASLRAASWTPLSVSPHMATAFGLVATAIVLVWLWRRRLTTDIDQQYALLSLACLIVSPLGWVYYLPACAGPVITVLARRSSPAFWLLGTLVMLPYVILPNHEYGRLGTLLVGQWAFLNFGGLAAAVSLQA